MGALAGRPALPLGSASPAAVPGTRPWFARMSLPGAHGRGAPDGREPYAGPTGELSVVWTCQSGGEAAPPAKRVYFRALLQDGCSPPRKGGGQPATKPLHSTNVAEITPRCTQIPSGSLATSHNTQGEAGRPCSPPRPWHRRGSGPLARREYSPRSRSCSWTPPRGSGGGLAEGGLAPPPPSGAPEGGAWLKPWS